MAGMPVYATTFDLAHALEKLARGETRRPLRRTSYQPQRSNSTQWLLDTDQLVNRHRAKLQVSFDPEAEAYLVGWGVEKGLSVPPGDPLAQHKAVMVMDEGWAWHALHARALAGELDATAAKAAGAASSPLLLDVHVWSEDGSGLDERRRWQVTDHAQVTALSTPDGHAPVLNQALSTASTLSRVFTLLPYTEQPGLWDTLYGDIYLVRMYPRAQALRPEDVFVQSVRPWLELL